MPQPHSDQGRRCRRFNEYLVSLSKVWFCNIIRNDTPTAVSKDGYRWLHDRLVNRFPIERQVTVGFEKMYVLEGLFIVQNSAENLFSGLVSENEDTGLTGSFLI